MTYEEARIEALEREVERLKNIIASLKLACPGDYANKIDDT